MRTLAYVRAPIHLLIIKYIRGIRPLIKTLLSIYLRIADIEGTVSYEWTYTFLEIPNHCSPLSGLNQVGYKRHLPPNENFRDEMVRILPRKISVALYNITEETGSWESGHILRPVLNWDHTHKWALFDPHLTINHFLCPTLSVITNYLLYLPTLIDWRVSFATT